MSRRLSGFKPTGHLHLGNYLGAIRPMVARQHAAETIVMIADLHALTVEHDPARLRRLTLEVATVLLACGVDPERSLFFVQSHVPVHTELHYLLECATGYGEAHRMIQFRDKAAGRDQVRLSLLTYPVLMAADILLYGATEVPVGDDQRQHIELARNVAERFNRRYGTVFDVPHGVHPDTAARVMDLADPHRKMDKSEGPGTGVLFLLDAPDTLRRKVARAVTDTAADVRYEPETRPGPANLLDILAACTGARPEALAAGFERYADLKGAVADAVEATLAPVRTRYHDLAGDPAVEKALAAGAERARDAAAGTVRRAKAAMGLQPAVPAG